MQSTIFDERARTFDRLPWVAHSELLGGIVKAITEFRDAYEPEIKSYVDLGCGTGEVIRYLKDLEVAHGFLKGASATGIDLSQGMIGLAQQKLSGLRRVTLLRASISAGKLAPSTYDFGVCRNAFHHFADPDQALAMMRQCIRPGGRVFIIEGVAPDEYTLERWRDVLLAKDVGRNAEVVLSMEKVEETFALRFGWAPRRVVPLSPVPVRVSQWLDNAPLLPESRRSLMKRINVLFTDARFREKFGLKVARRRPSMDYTFLKHSVLLEFEVG